MARIAEGMTMLVCEPHADSPFMPYRLVCLVERIDDSTFKVGAGKIAWPATVPSEWFTVYDQTLLPGNLTTDFDRAHFELSRSHGLAAVVYSKLLNSPRDYLIDCLEDRNVNARSFTDEEWDRLLGGLQYNHYD